jgi:hypothetical protein
MYSPGEPGLSIPQQVHRPRSIAGAAKAQRSSHLCQILSFRNRIGQETVVISAKCEIPSASSFDAVSRMSSVLRRIANPCFGRLLLPPPGRRWSSPSRWDRRRLRRRIHPPPLLLSFASRTGPRHPSRSRNSTLQIGRQHTHVDAEVFGQSPHHLSTERFLAR